MEHQEYQELLALHALDALDANELRALNEHLANCAECRAELIELRDTAGLLAYAATPAEPRAELRARIMADVAAGMPRGQTASETTGQVVQFSTRRQESAWPSLLKLAAGLAFLALLTGVVVLWKRNESARQEIADLKREAGEQRAELAKERDLVSLLTSPNAKRAELAGTQTAATARGSFVFDRQTGRAVLVTEGLPPTPPDKAYELWFIANGRPIPGKVFTVDPSGHAMVTDQVPPEARERAVFAITLEPKQGVSSPTGPIYLASPSS